MWAGAATVLHRVPVHHRLGGRRVDPGLRRRPLAGGRDRAGRGAPPEAHLDPALRGSPTTWLGMTRGGRTNCCFSGRRAGAQVDTAAPRRDASVSEGAHETPPRDEF